MERFDPTRDSYLGDWDPIHDHPELAGAPSYAPEAELQLGSDLVSENEREAPYGTQPFALPPHRFSPAERTYNSVASTMPSGLLDQDGGGASAFGPRRSSSFGTATSPRSFTWDSPALSMHAGHAAAFEPLSAATTPELLSSCASALLPSAVIDTSTIDLGPRRESLDRGVLSSSARAQWTSEQHAYRDVAADPFSVDEIATELLSPRHPFSPNSCSLRRSTSTYSIPSSSRSAPLGSYAARSTPGPSPRAGSRVRRQSSMSEPESTPPVKRTSPRKVATVTTTFDSKGSPTKSIRRISKLNLDASPSSRSPSVSPRKSARQQPPRLAPAPARDSRDSAQVPGEIGPAPRNVTRSNRRVSFGAVEHAPVPSVLLPADPINLSVSGVTLSPEDFALLEEATLLAEEDELPLPLPASAPPWCTSFELPTPPDEFYGPKTGGGTYDSPFHRTNFSPHEQVRPPSVSSFVLPANPHARAHSAYGETSITPHPNGLTIPAALYPPPASPVARRRRSSTSNYDYVPVSSQRYPVPASPWTSGFPTSHEHNAQHSSHHHHQQQQQHGPRTFKLPASGPSSASSSSPSPACDSRPVTPPPISAMAPMVVTPTTGGYPARAISAPTPKAPSSPKKKRSPAKTKRQPGAMFVNYSAQDAVRGLSSY